MWFYLKKRSWLCRLCRSISVDVITLTNPKVCETDLPEQIAVPLIAAVHDDRCAHQLEDFLEVQLFKFIPFRRKDQRVCANSRLVRVFA